MDNKVYDESPELKILADKIIERYHLYLGYIDTDNIFFAEITGNKPKKSPIIQVAGITSSWVRDIVLKSNNALYCIAVWAEEWTEISPDMQQWLIFDALLHVSEHNDGGLQKPDVNEFGILVEYLGPYWRKREDLPSLLGSLDPLPIPVPQDNTDEGSSVNF